MILTVNPAGTPCYWQPTARQNPTHSSNTQPPFTDSFSKALQHFDKWMETQSHCPPIPRNDEQRALFIKLIDSCVKGIAGRRTFSREVKSIYDEAQKKGDSLPDFSKLRRFLLRQDIAVHEGRLVALFGSTHKPIPTYKELFRDVIGAVAQTKEPLSGKNIGKISDLLERTSSVWIPTECLRGLIPERDGHILAVFQAAIDSSSNGQPEEKEKEIPIKKIMNRNVSTDGILPSRQRSVTNEGSELVLQALCQSPWILRNKQLASELISIIESLNTILPYQMMFPQDIVTTLTEKHSRSWMEVVQLAMLVFTEEIILVEDDGVLYFHDKPVDHLLVVPTCSELRSGAEKITEKHDIKLSLGTFSEIAKLLRNELNMWIPVEHITFIDTISSGRKEALVFQSMAESTPRYEGETSRAGMLLKPQEVLSEWVRNSNFFVIPCCAKALCYLTHIAACRSRFFQTSDAEKEIESLVSFSCQSGVYLPPLRYIRRFVLSPAIVVENGVLYRWKQNGREDTLLRIPTASEIHDAATKITTNRAQALTGANLREITWQMQEEFKIWVPVECLRGACLKSSTKTPHATFKDQSRSHQV